MTQSDSIFGAELDRLKRLLKVGDEDPDTGSTEHTPRTASLHIMSEWPGGQLGSYKLLSILGEGGMGVVYLAQQDQPIKRQVALKVIKPGMDSKRVIARFEAERQALALLDHPNIAHVYEAGTAESGRPYFVMEFVEGLPITEHCDHHKLTIEDRLDLFMQVCHAVHHAHQKGIIHRDIKPSNILVSTQDGRAIPKIIDFGVAKAVSQSLTERTLVTEQGQLFGTPEYMSPEQADMANKDIDTRSDIYSLGVLLYVLLTGVLPFDSETLREGGIEHIRQIIRQTDPKTPSTRLSNLGDEAIKVAESRRTEVARLARRLSRELEWIPLMAMRKERAERYQSASELADDIENYLKGEVLAAGPRSTIYRLKKFVRRNRALVVGIAALVAVLIAGTVVSTVFAIRAERQARTSQAISDFLSNDLLASVDPFMGAQHGVPLESLLDVASQGLEGKFETEPLIESSIRYTIGKMYRRLGKYDAAESNLKRAIKLRRETLGASDLNTLMCMSVLGWVYFRQFNFDKAEPLLAEAVDGMRDILSEDHPALLSAISRLGWIYCNQDRAVEAEKLQAAALEVVQRRLGPEHPYVPNHMEGLAAAYWHQGRVEEAEKLCRKALDISRRNPRYPRVQENVETINITRVLGCLCEELGRYDEAEELYLEALGARHRMYSEDHPETLVMMGYLGSLYRKLERYDEAKPLLNRELETNQRLFGDEDRGTLDSMIRVAELHRDQEQFDDAEQLLLKAEEIAHRVFGNDHKIINKSVNNLIELYEAWDKPEMAKEWQAKLPQTKTVDQ